MKSQKTFGPWVADHGSFQKSRVKLESPHGLSTKHFSLQSIKRTRNITLFTLKARSLLLLLLLLSLGISVVAKESSGKTANLPSTNQKSSDKSSKVGSPPPPPPPPPQKPSPQPSSAKTQDKVVDNSKNSQNQQKPTNPQSAPSAVKLETLNNSPTSQNNPPKNQPNIQVPPPNPPPSPPSTPSDDMPKKVTTLPSQPSGNNQNSVKSPDPPKPTPSPPKSQSNAPPKSDPSQPPKSNVPKTTQVPVNSQTKSVSYSVVKQKELAIQDFSTGSADSTDLPTDTTQPTPTAESDTHPSSLDLDALSTENVIPTPQSSAIGPVPQGSTRGALPSDVFQSTKAAVKSTSRSIPRSTAKSTKSVTTKSVSRIPVKSTVVVSKSTTKLASTKTGARAEDLSLVSSTMAASTTKRRPGIQDFTWPAFFSTPDASSTKDIGGQDLPTPTDGINATSTRPIQATSTLAHSKSASASNGVNSTATLSTTEEVYSSTTRKKTKTTTKAKTVRPNSQPSKPQATQDSIIIGLPSKQDDNTLPVATDLDQAIEQAQSQGSKPATNSGTTSGNSNGGSSASSGKDDVNPNTEVSDPSDDQGEDDGYIVDSSPIVQSGVRPSQSVVPGGIVVAPVSKSRTKTRYSYPTGFPGLPNTQDDGSSTVTETQDTPSNVTTILASTLTVAFVALAGIGLWILWKKRRDKKAQEQRLGTAKFAGIYRDDDAGSQRGLTRGDSGSGYSRVSIDDGEMVQVSSTVTIPDSPRSSPVPTEAPPLRPQSQLARAQEVHGEPRSLLWAVTSAAAGDMKPNLAVTNANHSDTASIISEDDTNVKRDSSQGSGETGGESSNSGTMGDDVVPWLASQEGYQAWMDSKVPDYDPIERPYSWQPTLPDYLGPRPMTPSPEEQARLQAEMRMGRDKRQRAKQAKKQALEVEQKAQQQNREMALAQLTRGNGPLVRLVNPGYIDRATPTPTPRSYTMTSNMGRSDTTSTTFRSDWVWDISDPVGRNVTPGGLQPPLAADAVVAKYALEQGQYVTKDVQDEVQILVRTPTMPSMESVERKPRGPRDPDATRTM